MGFHLPDRKSHLGFPYLHTVFFLPPILGTDELGLVAPDGLGLAGV